MITRSKGLVLLVAWLVLVAPIVWAQNIATEPRRETWQRVPDLFAAAGVRDGSVIADVGAGEGFLTMRLATAVGTRGRVYAVDTVESVVVDLRKRVAEARSTNVEVIVGAEDDPHLPSGRLDGVIILNAYHEMPHGVAMLRRIRAALKPGAHVVLCEPEPSDPGESRDQQVADHVLYPELIISDLQEAGFTIVKRQDGFATNLGGTRFGLVVGAVPE
jgi:predicted methyltransferase